MKHLLTIDIETPAQGWPGAPAAAAAPYDMGAAIAEILEVLQSLSAKATFFALADSCDAIREPLRACIAAGHEVACHGLTHAPVDTLDPDVFALQIRQAVTAISKASGAACRGFRAPWFRAPLGNERYLSALTEAGIVYDATPRVPLDASATAIRSGITQVPVPIGKIGCWRPGILGGPALRLLPRGWIQRLMRDCEQAGRPACVVLHPYEWTGVPGLPLSLTRPALRRKVLTHRTLPRLRALAGSFAMTSIADYLDLEETTRVSDAS